MAFKLIDLPYPDTALEPAVSARTLSFHHGKHHKAYIDKTNGMIEGTDLADKSMEDVVIAARGTNQGLFNNAAQAWNHGFYWYSMAAKETTPSEELETMVKDAFGSFDALKAKLAERGAAHFASGWVWLAVRDGKLVVEDTHDAETLVGTGANPLLVIDLWEHAYYLDHQNLRPQYLDQVNGKINWAFASENLARGTVWAYPA